MRDKKQQEQHETVTNDNNTEQWTEIAQCVRAHMVRRYNADGPHPPVIEASCTEPYYSTSVFYG